MNEILYYFTRYGRTYKNPFNRAAFYVFFQLQVGKYAEEVLAINLYYAQLKNNSLI